MPRMFKAILAPLAALAMVFALFTTAGASASGGENNTEQPELTADGWKNSRNYVRYSLNRETGVLTFWSENPYNGSWFDVEFNSGPNAGWLGSITVLDGATSYASVRLKRCGVKTKAEIYSRWIESRVIPAWPCKGSQAGAKVKAKVKSLKVIRPNAPMHAPSRTISPRTVVRGVARPAGKVQRVRVVIRHQGKVVAKARMAKGKKRWRVVYPRAFRPGKYTVVAKVKPKQGKAITVKRTFRVR